MKYFKFFLSFTLLIAIFYLLNTKFGSIPAIGKFLYPTQGIWQNEASEATINANFNIKGFSNSVTVHYDKYLIPHIFAQNDTDLYKAQGYITAKHRLWQMDFQIRAAAGRLSEVIGVDAINYDKIQRRKGMVFGAENNLKVILDSPDNVAVLEAFRDGVNTYISSLEPKDYPVEFKLLDYKPEPWTLKKTALLLMFMTDMLAGGGDDLEYTNMLKKFGKERFDLLFPDFFQDMDPVIPNDSTWTNWQVNTPEVPKDDFIYEYTKETIPKPHPDNGSNNWAISPEKSYSGNPILANDPHLGLNLPSIWFAMQLATPDKNTYGVTLPGSIGIIIGFNNNISWGVTNATRDVKDWYKITFKDGNRNEYLYDGSWKATTKTIEEIKVRGQKTVIDTVVYTHHGPVTYDATFKGRGDKIGYAMKWVGHLGGDITNTFIKLNEAKNYNDYKDAIKTYVAPAQNFAFSSNQGDIALWVQGKFPNKWKGQGKFLMDGSNPKHDWQSFIPQQHNAHIKNPKRGFVSSANQTPTDSTYPYYYFNDGYDTYRSRVINTFFRSKEKFNIQDFKDLHNNNYNLKAAEILPQMITSIEGVDLNEKERDVLDEIKSWDYYNDIGKTGPIIWSIWSRDLYRLVWDEMQGDSLAMESPYIFQTINMLKNYPNDEFMDIIDTPKKETAQDLFLISFKDTVEHLDNLEESNWGDYKGTYVGHLLQGLPAFSRLNLPIGGDGGIVNATSRNHGPSWRMIVEMSSPPQAIGIYPGGQSGNPGSKYYDNFIDDWAAGTYMQLYFLQDASETQNIKFTHTLSSE